MPWTYYSRTGKVYWNDQYIAKGYSGNTIGLNNPNFQWLSNIGPIPPGKYNIGTPKNSAKTGAFIMELTPMNHHAMGRKAFQIHGDNKKANHSASSGCIILSKKDREQIAKSGDNILIVVGVKFLQV